jgi:hypothetical protein
MRSPRLIDVLLAELEDEGTLDLLAERLGPRLRLAQPAPASAPDRWMDSAAAADYLGISRNALHKHTAARTIPFEQSGPNGKLWFRAAELDEWRRGQQPGALETATPRRCGSRYVRAAASH